MTTFSSQRCIAVDDDPLSLKLAEAACKKLNLELSKASDAHQMIDLLKDKSFDLILLDNDIAGVRGYEVLEYVDSYLRPNMQIIVYSSSVTDADKSRYKRFHVKEYLIKPLSVDVIGFVMRKLLKI